MLLDFMAKEIEKKFLLRENGISYVSEKLQTIYPSVEELKKDVLKRGNVIRQGYLSLINGRELSDLLKLEVDFSFSEARLRDRNGKFYFTLKGDGGLSRNELEMELEESCFNNFWLLTENKYIEKVRLDILYQRHTLEIDVYTDRDLIVAEIEVSSSEEANSLSVLGLDVTENPKYKNRNLAK